MDRELERVVAIEMAIEDQLVEDLGAEDLEAKQLAAVAEAQTSSSAGSYFRNFGI